MSAAAPETVAPAPAASSVWSKLAPLFSPIPVLLLCGIILYDHFDRRPGPPAPAAVDGQTLGKAFAPQLAASYAAAWTAAAAALEGGQTVTQAQAVLQQTWQAGRSAAFSRLVAPHLAAVLPEGTEPATPGQRAAVVNIWRDFAKGLTAKGK